jgi:tetratricopeptide (TPR) repeat protein
MQSTKNLLQKAALAISVLVIFMAASFALDQWRAENTWPVHRDFTRQEMQARGIDKASALRHAIRLSPDNAAYHILLGKYNVYEADAEASDKEALLNEAASEYRMAIFLNPSLTDTLSYLAWAEFSLNKPLAAMSRLETATNLDPNNYFNHLYYGICVTRFLAEIPSYLRGIYLRRAEEELDRGVRINPMMARQPMVLSARADLYLRRDDVSSAIEELKKAGAPNEITLPYHLRLAGIYLRSGMTKEGIWKYNILLNKSGLIGADKQYVIRHLKASTKAYPDIPELRYFLGEALLEEEDWAGAVDALKGLAAAGFRPPQTHYLLAQAYEGLGDRKSAYEEYVITLRYNRSHPVASKKVIELFKEGTSK